MTTTEVPSTPEHLLLTDLPDGVARALVGLVDAAREGPDARSGGDAPTREQLGDLVLAAKTVQSWAEAAEIDATRQLLHDLENDLLVDLGQAEPGSTAQTRRGEARRAVACELQLLTGGSLQQCRDRVALASATDERAGYLRTRMAHGTLSAHRAITVLKETRHLDPSSTDHIARHALRPVGSRASSAQTPDTLLDEIAAIMGREPVSQATFRDRLRREVTRAEGADLLARRAAREAVAARDVQSEPGDHATGITWITAARDRVFTAQHRVDTLARRARAAGDPRTLAQLRSDIATDLLIHGTVPGDHLLATPSPVRLNVFVSLETILPGHEGVAGQAHAGVAEVPGLGYLTGDQVRQLALAAGSTWRRLVTDPTTGAVIDASRTYRPSQAMGEFVVARDRRCRAPGCEYAAHESDLDHDTNWSATATDARDGATHPDNLHALHRGHHHAKTRGWWSSVQEPDGVIRWTTLTGRRIRSHPPRPPDDSAERRSRPTRSEQRIAQLLEHVLDPPPLHAGTAVMHDVLITQRSSLPPPART